MTTSEKNQKSVSSMSAALQTALSKKIHKAMKKHKVVGLSLALVDDGEIVWATGFGYADRENKKHANENTLYKIGSITKVFTGMAIMQLVEKGLLDLNAPVQTYIPELNIRYHKPTNNPITLRHLLSHTSGLPVDKMAGMFNNKDTEHFSVAIDFLNQVHAPYEPGTIATYSNLGMDLAGIIIERATGMRYEDYMQANILMPLNMSHSVLNDNLAEPRLISKGYRKNKLHGEYPLRSVPAGNIHSSALEMANFIKSVLNHGSPIISAASFNEMTRVQTNGTVFDSGAVFGLNWFLQNPRLAYLGPVLNHNGGTINFVSNLTIVPKQKLGLIMLCNTAMQIPFLEETSTLILQKAAQLKTGLTPPPTTHWPENITPPEATINTSLGDYVTPLGIAKIGRDNKGVFALVHKKKIRLHYHQDGWFSLRYKLLGLIPIPLPGLNKVRVQIKQIANEKILYVEENETSYIIGKTFQPKPISSIWKSRLGEYQVDYIEGDYHWFEKIVLTEKDNMLSLNIKNRQFGGAPLFINPLNDEMAIIEGIGRAMQETIYAKGKGKTSALFYSGYRLYKMN